MKKLILLLLIVPFALKAQGYGHGVGAVAGLTMGQLWPMPAIAGFPSTVSGPSLDTLHVREEVMAFDNTGSDSLFFVSISIPYSFRQIDSIGVISSTASTDGDSVGWKFAYNARAHGEATGLALDSVRTIGQVDLGSGDVQIRLLSVGVSFPGVAAGDELLFAIWRDNSISNNVAATVWLHYIIIYWS